MRALVDLPERQLRELGEIGKAAGVSRAEIIRRAIDAFLAQRRRPELADAFGLWRHRQEDGLAYQERLRGEW